MTTVVLAEKPSVARDIARVLGASRKHTGYIEGNGYRITWALGHLVHYAEPDDYSAAWKGRWSPAQLPMIPQQWKLKLDKKTSAQFKIVKGLINAADTDTLVCATDAGREGEHIFRLIYHHAHCKKPFKRLWVSSLTDDAIRAGFAALKPGEAYDHLATAAAVRARADWLVGMNLTRAYTVHNRVLCTIGRVQTPTLALIVARDAQISGFTKVYFYELLAHLQEGFSAKYSNNGETKIEKKLDAQALHKRLEPHRTGTVTEVKQEIQHNRPPPFYDLTTLQRDANRRFGFTAAKVLELAQALYETQKLISYPRTESRHISEDMVPKLPGILANLEHPQAPAALARCKGGHKLGKAYVDQTKLTDHHAIIPTGRKPSPGLPADQRKVLDLVMTRFVAVFLPDERVEETRVSLDIGGELFVARGAKVLDPGWKIVEPKRQDAGDGDELHRELPPLTEGQTVHVDRLEVQEKETKPPRPYSDATLLSAMKNAGRKIEDRDLAKAMRGSGLGTPATRAEIIEKLVRTGYVERKRKQILSTDKGRALIERVAEPLRSPELTAGWELKLKEVEEGKRRGAEFYAGIVSMVQELVPMVWQGRAFAPEQVAAFGKAGKPGGKGRRGRRGAKAAARPSDLGACPTCKQGQITETDRAYGCSRYGEGCRFTIWKEMAGVRLDQATVKALIDKGRTERIEGFKSKQGKPFAAALRLDANGKVSFEFDAPAPAPAPAPASAPASAPEAPAESEPGPDPATAEPPVVTCPSCGEGRIIEGRRAYGCNRYREGCHFTVPKHVEGRDLSWDEIAQLINQRRLGPLGGFTCGEATLRLDDQLQLRTDARASPRLLDGSAR